MPEISIDEARIFEGPFCLVSYSHRDKDAVYDDIKALQEKKARIWIDHSRDSDNMTYGDNWREKIENALSHPNCVGAFIYISPYSLAGKATQWEHEQIRSRGLKYYIISMNRPGDASGTRFRKHFSAAEALCDEDDSTEPCYIDPTYYDNIEPKQKEWINDDVLHIRRTDSEQCSAALLEIAESYGIISTAARTKQKLDSFNKKDYSSLFIGICKSREVSDIMPEDRERNSRFRRGGASYLCIDRRVYTTKPIEWHFLYTKPNAVHVFIADEVLGQCPWTDIDAFLRVFGETSLDDSERKLISSVRILSGEDIESTEPVQLENALKLPDDQRGLSWWVDKPGLLDAWMQTYKDNRPYGYGFLVKLAKGVRPVIEITDSDLKAIMSR